MDWRYACITYISIVTAHILLILVLVYVPATSFLRAWLLPVLLLPTFIVSQTAHHATHVMPLNFIIGVGFGPRLALEIFDLVCISKVEYPGYGSKVARSGPLTVNGAIQNPGKEKDTKEEDSWLMRCSHALVWFGEIASSDRRQDGFSAVSRRKAKLTSKRNFLIFRAVRFVLGYLLLDVLTAQSLEGVDVKFGIGKERILARIAVGDFSKQDFGETLGSCLAFAMAGYLNLTVLFDLISVLSVATGVTGVGDWPPVFGPLTEAYSIRNFWSVVWHRQLRVLLDNHSFFITHNLLRLPPASEATQSSKFLSLLIRYTRIQSAFLTSGIMHITIDSMQKIPLRESGVTMFFTIQGVGILIEDIVCSVHRRINTGSFSRSKQSDRPALWKRLVGFTWFICWMLWCLPPWIFPTIRRPPMSAVPYSFFK